jgi:hypothetical protein
MDEELEAALANLQNEQNAALGDVDAKVKASSTLERGKYYHNSFLLCCIAVSRL